MKTNRTRYSRFKKRLETKIEAVRQLVVTAKPHDDWSDYADDTKNECLDEIDRLEEFLTDYMGEILGN